MSSCRESAPERRPASASIGEASVDLIQAFDRACELSGISHKHVAILMECSREQLYQMLRQQRPLSLVRLLKLRDFDEGRKFLRCYWPLVGEAMGLPEFSDGLRVADALQMFIQNMQIRMVKCELVSREVQDEEKSA